MSGYDSLVSDLDEHSDPVRAQHSQRFFKTGKGEYGEGDVFIGLTMPDLRKVCRDYRNLSLDDLQKLLDSPIHEHRVSAVVIMSEIMPKSDEIKQKALYELYIKNVRNDRINNWDIIDISARKVVGVYLLGKSKDILFELASTDHLWSKRTALLSTFMHFDRDDEYLETSLKLADMLVYDDHDLIQKAVGWMLREIGKRVDEQLLYDFLDKYAATMPRTALRYALEQVPANKKQLYMTAKDRV